MACGAPVRWSKYTTIDIRPYGQIRPFGSAVWSMKFGCPVFYLFGHPDSAVWAIPTKTSDYQLEKTSLEIAAIL